MRLTDHYDFRSVREPDIGPPNQEPLPITLRIAAVPVYRVFQALGAEAGTRATVEIDPLHHQVQVIHHV